MNKIYNHCLLRLLNFIPKDSFKITIKLIKIKDYFAIHFAVYILLQFLLKLSDIKIPYVPCWNKSAANSCKFIIVECNVYLTCWSLKAPAGSVFCRHVIQIHLSFSFSFSLYSECSAPRMHMFAFRFLEEILWPFLVSLFFFSFSLQRVRLNYPKSFLSCHDWETSFISYYNFQTFANRPVNN